MLDLLEKKVGNKYNSIKYLDLLKKEISQYIDSKNPTEELLKKLQNNVKSFINSIEKKHCLDTLDLPSKEIIKYNYNKNNKKYEKISKKYELLFWFNSIEEKLDLIFDINTNEKEYMDLIMSLINDCDLEPILTFINDKKLENTLTDYDDLKTTKQMLRGILISKIKKENIDLDDFKNIVKDINSKINQPGEISDEEYYLSYILSDNYSKNLKITMPIFEPLDVFFFFFKYVSGNKDNKELHYELSDFLKDAYNKCPFKLNKIHKILDDLEQTKNKDMNKFLEYICSEFFYVNICRHEFKVNSGESVVVAMKNRSKKMEEKDNNKKYFLNTIIYYLEFIKEFNEKIVKKQNNNKDDYKFVLNDLEKLLDINKNEQTACSNIFKNKKLFSSTFIYYVNNNQEFINNLFKEINLPKEIKDIEYLPFWLFILRNISFLNCLEYNNNYVDQNIANNIVNKIKEKIIDPFQNYDWMNLLTDNIAIELYNKKINSFYIFFNSLFENMILSEKNVNLYNLIKSELENYFNEIIYYSFAEKNKFDYNKRGNKIFKFTINKFDYNKRENKILKFTKDPATYLYKKVKGYINQKFLENKDNLNIGFYTRIKKLDENFKLQLNKAKDKLKDLELENLLSNRAKKVEKIFSNLLELYSKYTLAIKNIQISDEKLAEFWEIQNELSKYENNGTIKKETLACYTITYDFTNLKNTEYNLKYDDIYIQTDHFTHKGKIHIITNFNAQQDQQQNTQQFIQKFSIYKKISKYKKNKRISIKNVSEFIQINYNESYTFSKFEIETEEKIQNNIQKNIKIPTLEDVKSIPLITLGGNKEEVFFESLKKIENSTLSLLHIILKIKDKETYNESIFKELENTIDSSLISMKDIKGMFILNINDFPDLNFALKEIENAIYNCILNLEKFYDNYKKSLKDILYEFFNFNRNNIFSFDFSLPELPKTINNTNISLFGIDIINSKNLCVPFITLFNEEKKLISSFSTLNLNFNACPALFNGFYTINIISFVNEDMTAKLKKNKDNNEIQKELKPLIKVEDDQEIDYLLVKNKYIKIGENIQLCVKIPQVFEEISIKKSYILRIKTINSKQKLNLNVNMNLTTTPISLIISCKEYNLIKEQAKDDNHIKYEHYFKLDTYELLSDEIINFELLNYKREEPIEFYLSVKCLKDNISNIPEFLRRKQNNNFNIKIPEYICKNNETEFPRLQCMFNIQINKYCVIHIKIDALIRHILNIFKIYDFNSKNYVENQMQIDLDKNEQILLKKYYEGIKLNCILYSTLENNQFLVTPGKFEGGYFKKKKDIIKNGKCKFTLELKFSKYQIIQNGTECLLNIYIKEKTIPFKIIFLNKNNDYINNKIDLDNQQKEIINYISDSQNNDITYYYIDYEGKITSLPKYIPIIEENENKFYENKFFPLFFPFYYKKNKVPFCFRYKQFWYPLIIKDDNIYSYNSPHFEAWKKLKNQNDIHLVNFFKEKIKKDMKYFEEGRDNLTFERIAYHILYNTENTLSNLHGLFPNSIKEILNNDYQELTYKIGEEKNLALFRYIIKLQEIFNEHKLINPKIFSYYSNEQKFLIQDENPSKLIESFENKLKLFKTENKVKIKSSKNFLIKGNISETYDKNGEQEIDESNNEINLIPNNTCTTMKLPEIDLIEYNKFCSVDFIFKFYDNLKMGAIIFPFYLQLAMINNKNEEKKLKEINNYFDTLFTVYSSVIKHNNKENKNKSIVNLELKEFISSYETLIIKLKKEGIDMKKNQILNSINDEMYNKN